jgi:hypothetical protein
MWESPAHERPREDAADFLFEPLPARRETTAAAPAATRETDSQAAIESELFAGPVAPISGPAAVPPVAATARAVAAAAAPVASGPAPPVRPPMKPMPRHAVDDPLAALIAMSDEEKIALFT